MNIESLALNIRAIKRTARVQKWLPVLKLTVLASVLTVASATAQAPLDIRVALIIGNSAYAGAPLVNPANDARAMGEILRGLGFQVVELRDGSKAQMTDSIAKVQSTLKGKQGVGMLYYAGHGLQLDWRNYMVPVDAKLSKASDVPQQTVDLSLVIEAFKAAGNRMNIVVLDACRDNPFSSGTSSAKGLAQLDAPTGTFLAYATAPGNVAEDGDEKTGNGLYTQFLLQELKKPTAKIEDVFKRVRLQVRRQSEGRQIPWESTSLEEDFMFNDGVKFTFKREDLERMAAAVVAREREKLQAETRLLEQQRLAAQARAKEAERLSGEARAREEEKLANESRAREQQRIALQNQEREREQAELARLKETERLLALIVSPAAGKRPSKEEQLEISFKEEKAAWDKIKNSNKADDFYAFLERFPSGGELAEMAQYRLDQLAKPKIQASLGKGQDASLGYSGGRFKVGDVFEFQESDILTNIPGQKITNRVTSIEGDVVSINNGAVLVTALSGLIKNPTRSFDPPWGGLPVEFQIGKTWTGRSTQKINDGQIIQLQQTTKIVKIEAVTVPAGTFQTYLLESNAFTSTGLSINLKVWVDPRYGVAIKREEIARAGSRMVRSDRRELVAIKADRS